MKTLTSAMLLSAALTARVAAAQAAPGVPLSEDFDGVTPPALPYGWVATNVVGDDPKWATVPGSPDTPPNAAYVPDPFGANPGTAGDKRLDSPPIAILTGGARLWFRHSYLFSSGPCGGAPQPGPSASTPDGCVFYATLGSLWISIGGGDFEDILDAGGSFVTDGYTVGDAWAVQNADYPIYDTVRVDLPASATGQTVVLRWRITSLPWEYAGGGTGWWVDSIRICDGFTCYGVPQPSSLAVDLSGNGVWEPGETVVVSPSYYNGSHGLLPLTAGVGDVAGPPGSSFQIADGSANYGTIAPAAFGGCVDTGDCYGLHVDDSGTRPAQHWDEQLWEDLSNGEITVWALHVGGSFADVPASNPFYAFVETIFHRGVTGGCSGASYCPEDPALRKQMAVFLLKAKLGSAYVPPPAAGIFEDVPASDPFAPWVENLYNLGITGGCATWPLLYCPDQTVLRKQMAVFLLKSLNGNGYAPPACQGIFADVPCPSPFADWIEALYAQQIAAGCGNNDFCPDNPNTRGQMSVFLAKTFGLTLYGP